MSTFRCMPAEHFYIVTEPIARTCRPNMPVLRIPDECAYYKEDAGKMLLGAFEPNAKPWGMDGIPEDFSFDSLPDDFDHFEPVLEAAMTPGAGSCRERRHPASSSAAPRASPRTCATTWARRRR